MDVISLTAARARFSKLIDRVEAGERIVIARRGKPVAVLTPVEEPRIPVGGARLKALTGSMPPATVCAEDLVRSMRDAGY